MAIDARTRLDMAMRNAQDNGHRLACTDDPGLFAADSRSASSVACALVACRTRCPIFDDCRAWAATGPDITGVIGGVFRPESAKHPVWARRGAHLARRYEHLATLSPAFAALPLWRALEALVPTERQQRVAASPQVT